MDGQLASGGTVRRGGRYLVGEDGAEIFEADQDGQIHPNSVYQAITNPLSTLGDLGVAARGPAPRMGSPAPASIVSGGIHIALTVTNPVVDSDARLQQFKRETLAEAMRLITASLNRTLLAEG